jgi:hypothetical protein
MSLDFIHTIFSASSQGHWMNISAPGTIFLGSPCLPTHNCAHRFNPFSELLVSDGLGSGDVWVSDWEYPDIYIQPNEGPVMLPNGWTRYDCPFFKPWLCLTKKSSVALADLPMCGECQLRKRIELTWEAEAQVRKTWLSQANHVMHKSGLNAGKH